MVTWRWWEAILLYVIGALAVGGILVGGLMLAVIGIDDATEISGSMRFALGLAADLAFLGVMAAWLSSRHQGWPTAVGLRASGRSVREVAVGAGLGLLLYPAILIASGMIISFFQALSGRQVTPPDQVPPGLSTGGKVLVVLLAVFVAPVVEELFFRGVLFRSIRDRVGFPAGVIVSSAIFGLVHWESGAWLDVLALQTTMMFTGLGLAAIYEKRGTLLASIGAHFTFNVIGVTIILSTG